MGLRTKPGFLEPCRAEKNKGSNMQGAFLEPIAPLPLPCGALLIFFSRGLDLPAHASAEDAFRHLVAAVERVCRRRGEIPAPSGCDRMYVCMHACMYACMNACMHACMCVYVCIYIYICRERERERYAHTHTHI